MKRTRAFSCAVGVLAAGLLAGVGACGSTPDGPGTAAKRETAGPAAAARTGPEQVSAPSARACAGGTYTWFNLREHSVLNGVTEVQRVTAGRTAMTEPMRRLRTDRASLETEGPRLDPHAVFLALSMRLGLAEKDEELDDPASWSGLGEPGAYAPLDEGGGTVSGLEARLVNFSALTLVEADFRYACEGDKDREPAIGHVSTWGRTLGGVLNCEAPLPEDASAAAHEAVRLSCGR